MARRQNRSITTARRNRKRAYQLVLVGVTVVILAYFIWPKPQAVAQREPGVTIVDAFYSTSPQFTDNLVGLLNSSGVESQTYKDNITVEFYRTLPNITRTILVLRVHAGVFARDPTSPTYLFTTEPYDAGRYFVEQLSAQVLSGVLDPENKSETPVFTVGPAFITASMQGNLSNTIVILSSCLGLYNNQLAQEIVKKGAVVFISWDEKVSLYHTDQAISLLIKTLVQDRGTVDEAVTKVMNEVGRDQTYNSSLEYYPREAGNLRLKP